MHHHLAPPAYIADLKKHQRGAPPTLEWTPEKSLVDMDSSGIATAVLSITTPGVWFGDGDDASAATLARACNDYGAKLIADHGRRFGMFAALPLPAVDEKGSVSSACACTTACTSGRVSKIAA